jgi:hypothetical protein
MLGISDVKYFDKLTDFSKYLEQLLGEFKLYVEHVKTTGAVDFDDFEKFDLYGNIRNAILITEIMDRFSFVDYKRQKNGDVVLRFRPDVDEIEFSMTQDIHITKNFILYKHKSLKLLSHVYCSLPRFAEEFHIKNFSIEKSLNRISAQRKWHINNKTFIKKVAGMNIQVLEPLNILVTFDDIVALTIDKNFIKKVKQHHGRARINGDTIEAILNFLSNPVFNVGLVFDVNTIEGRMLAFLTEQLPYILFEYSITNYSDTTPAYKIKLNDKFFESKFDIVQFIKSIAHNFEMTVTREKKFDENDSILIYVREPFFIVLDIESTKQ